MCITKPVNANIGKLIKNPEMLKFIPNHLKTKYLCNYAEISNNFKK